MTDADCLRLVATDALLQELLVELELTPDRLHPASLGHRQFKALCEKWREKDEAPRNDIPVIGDLVAFVGGGYGVVMCVTLGAEVPFQSAAIEGVPFWKRAKGRKEMFHTGDDIECIVAGSPTRRLNQLRKRANKL